MSETEGTPATAEGGEPKVTASASAQPVADSGGDAAAAPGTEPDKAEVKKPKKDKIKACKKFMYNKETKQVLGRTGMSWLKIFIFYLFLYVALGVFFIFMLAVAIASMPAKEPKYGIDGSLVGKQPGLSYLPVMKYGKGDDASSSHVFNFKKDKNKDEKDDAAKDPMKMGDLAKQIQAYLDVAEANGRKDCGMVVGETHARTKKLRTDAAEKNKNDTGACNVYTTTTNLGPCTGPTYGWEYDPKNPSAFSPCVLIKLNRIWGWKPNKPKSPPKEKSTRDAMTNATDAGDKAAIETSVQISCKSTKNKGKATIVGYYPYAGIPAYYFPFLGQKDYVNPFIMVKFKDIQMNTKNKGMAEIECKVAGGKEIKFQFVLDNPPTPKK